MPDLEDMDLPDKAVLWPRVGTDVYGEPTLGPPQEIDTFWVTKRTEKQDRQGNTVLLDGIAVVDLEIPVGSNLWLGELADWLGTGSASTDNELMYVKMYNEGHDLKARSIRRTVGLMRFRNTLS